ncbi:relaxase domain-containing protein [Parvularcula sp. ZS-1/3]|uniref:Relaxase domain-containing protein n=1 Tax=Parvularcula mediterranea TaxID=2732508 RepID=A0A7Y3RNT3_9PROT|nr:relaxase domain-containing protein [Parvularcula mediterranea]
MVIVASISGISSASAGASYYGRDNYYARDKDDAEPSAWFGRGASALGLSGPVDTKTFERILRGETLDGKRVGQRENETAEAAEARTHRPGIDLTFSPPKDVSLLLYLGGDKRILGAHRTAVDQTLTWTERNLAAARVREDGKAPVPLRTGNLVVAKFEHDISRDKDPQLHTHAVIANMTQTEDGRWRALHNDPMFRHAKLAGLAYDAAMREQLRELGYKVKLENGRSGAYSIEGVPAEARSEFSRGAERIRSISKELDHDTPKTREAVALKSRPSKTTMSQDERTVAWQERGGPWTDQLHRVAEAAVHRQRTGDIERPLSEEAPRGPLAAAFAELRHRFFKPSRSLSSQADDPYRSRGFTSERSEAARAAVSFGIRHLEEREAAFSAQHVRRAALEHGADGLTLKDIDRQLMALRERKLVRVNAADPDAEATTARSFAQEQRTDALVRGAGKTDPLVGHSELESALSRTSLTPGQKSAITTILGGTDRLVGVQGYAGTGKTTMMRHASELARDLGNASGREGPGMLGLAPTHSAARSLSEGGGIETRTVARFLTDLKQGRGPGSLAGRIVLVDESSFLSTKSMNLVLERILALEPSRLVLLGDRRQHGAIEAGRPFDQAQRNGMTTTVMKDVVRLPRDAQHQNQRRAVEAAAEGHVARAMKRIEGNIAEAPGALAEAAASAWKALPKERQDAALIVAPGHRLRGAINAEIRDAMIEDGRLGSEATSVGVALQKDMTRAEAESARSYDPGDMLKFHRRVDQLNVKPGHQRRVVSVDEQRGTVTLVNSRGRQQTLPLSKLTGKEDALPYSVFQRAKLDIREGDRLMFARSDPSSGIAALDRASVLSFDDKTITLQTNGEPRVFERSDPALEALTHAYAVTSHASQGQTAKDVITVIDSSERQLTSQTAFYVGISRSADTVSVIVDDKQRTLDALHRNTGLKTSAIEASARMEELTGLDQEPGPADPAEASNDGEAAPSMSTTEPPAADRDEPDAGAEISL